jgi:hypothetical protein
MILLTECNCLVVIVRTYNFEILPVAHEPSCCCSDNPPLRLLDQSCQFLLSILAVNSSW